MSNQEGAYGPPPHLCCRLADRTDAGRPAPVIEQLHVADDAGVAGGVAPPVLVAEIQVQGTAPRAAGAAIEGEPLRPAGDRVLFRVPVIR